MKTYVLYHANCHDGFGAAFAAWLRFGDAAEYLPVSYGQPVPALDPGSNIYILDFSYPKEIFKAMWKIHKSIAVLDHHATARDDLASLDGFYDLFVRFEMEKSGAVLAWEHFFPGASVPEFFLYLQDRDLWSFKLPDSREVSCALRSYPMDFMVWAGLTGLNHTDDPINDTLHRFDSRRPITRLATEGTACLRLTEQMVDIMARNHTWRHFAYEDVRVPSIMWPAAVGVFRGPNGWTVPVANATCFFSEVGERLLQLYPDAPFAAYYLDRKDGLRQWGMRSREGFDCSVVAKVFGGGGHKQAAGFTERL